jgi:hypothetical protein
MHLDNKQTILQELSGPAIGSSLRIYLRHPTFENQISSRSSQPVSEELFF